VNFITLAESVDLAPTIDLGISSGRLPPKEVDTFSLLALAILIGLSVLGNSSCIRVEIPLDELIISVS